MDTCLKKLYENITTKLNSPTCGNPHYRSEMTIFFGASSGVLLGNVMVKTPFSIVAVISSSCTIYVNPKKLEKDSDNILLCPEGVAGCAKTSRESVRVMNSQCLHDPQTSSSQRKQLIFRSGS